MTTSKLQKLQLWFFSKETSLPLKVFKFIICVYLLLFHSTPSSYNLYGTSGEFIPVGTFHLLPRLQDAGLLVGISYAFQLSLVAALFGVFAGPALIMAVLSGAYVLAYHYNFGTVGHGTTLIYSCLCILALVPWTVWKKDYHGLHARWPLTFIKCFIVGSYFIAGLQKLRHSGFEWAWSENLAINLYQNQASLLGQILLESPPAILRSLALIALMIELLSPLALFSKKAAYVFVALWVSMHLGIQFTFGHHKSFLSQIPCLLVFCEGLLLFAGETARVAFRRLVKIVGV